MWSSLWCKCTASLKGFGENRRGSVLTMVGIAIVPLVAFIGLSTDAGRGYMVKARLGQAVDAAALAGGRAFFESYREDDVRKYFEANFPPGYLASTPDPVPLSITFDEDDGTVTVEASVDIPTSFLRVLMMDHMSVSSRAQVQRELSGLELAMVLDVTGSMSGSKLTSLKLAANSLLDILYGTNETQEGLWVSLVPFAGRVNVQPYDEWLTDFWQNTPPTPWSGCMHPRTDENATNDNPPGDNFPFSERFPGYDPDPAGERPENTYGCPACNSSDSCTATRNAVLPLTAEKTTVVEAIDDMVAYSNTRTDIGMVWGWRAVSPQWRGVWDTDATLPLDYDEPKMEKAVVLMTDGENTPSLNGDPETVTETNDNLAQTCEDMKDAGIIVYTITFQAPNTLDDLFRDCASEPGNYFDSPTNDDLVDTFKVIGSKLSKLRLAQ